MSTEGSTRAILAAFGANLGIAVAKFVAFVFTGSSSMLAESIHSVADTSNQGLLLLGGRRARRRATPTHQFGFGRERYFWAFVVALVIFSVGSLFAVFEGIDKLRHPEPIESPEWAIGVLLVAMVLEGLSLRTAARESRRSMRKGMSWWSFVREARKPELPVVLMEDFGALAGLTLALAAITTSIVTDEPRWDAVGTLSIGILLGIIAMILSNEMRSLLVGESVTRENLAAIEEGIAASPRVQRLIHLRTQHLGPEQILVAAKLQFDPDLDMEGLARAIDETEKLIRDRLSGETFIFIEPDIYRSDREKGTGPQS